jgi:hypothetical protein
MHGFLATSVSDRPIPGTGPHEIVNLKQSFEACGKLSAMPNRPVLSAMSGKIIYSPSRRKVALLVAFLLMLSWICFKKSNTYDETAHRLALCGSGLFVLFAVVFLIQFFRGLPTFTLTESGFIWNTGISKDLRPWSSYYNFTVGHSLGLLESIKFVREDTGADGAILNVSNVPAHAICEKLNEWQKRYSKDDVRDPADCS